MAGKGGKGLLAAKTTAANKDKDKKKPVSRSSRAGLQVKPYFSFRFLSFIDFPSGLFWQIRWINSVRLWSVFVVLVRFSRLFLPK